MAHAKLSHRQTDLLRFAAVLLVVVLYTIVSIRSYGVAQGLSVTALTWAFFVFATPIADGGFLVAFPIRLITGFRMLYTQFVVWTVGILLVAYYLYFSPEVFEKSALLQLFYAILTTPWPLGIILILSGIGTYISIRFDDEVVDVAASKQRRSMWRKHRKSLAFNIGMFATTLVLYVVLLRVTHTDIALF